MIGEDVADAVNLAVDEDAAVVPSKAHATEMEVVDLGLNVGVESGSSGYSGLGGTAGETGAGAGLTGGVAATTGGS